MTLMAMQVVALLMTGMTMALLMTGMVMTVIAVKVSSTMEVSCMMETTVPPRWR